MFTEPIFSVKDVADLLNIPKNLVYKLINVGKLKSYMNNRKEGYRITKEDFKEYCIEKEINFDEILEKYYKKNGINIDKEKVSPQDNNSILGYPPPPYNPGYTAPNMYYDPTHSPDNKDKFSVCDHKRPKYFENDHNSLYSTIEIGNKFGIDPYNFYKLLEKLGYLYIVENRWIAPAPFIRFGLVKCIPTQTIPLWTYIGKNFLEDQLIYEVGFDYVNQEKNRELVRKILGVFN